jgi:hypothetical protein
MLRTGGVSVSSARVKISIIEYVKSFFLAT